MRKTSGLVLAIALTFSAALGSWSPALAKGPAIDAGSIVAGCKYNQTGGPAFAGDGYANLQCDQNGNLKTVGNGVNGGGSTSQAGGATPYPTYAPGTAVAPLSDSMGALILSPQSIIRDAPGLYQVNPQPLVDGQSSQILTDINGRPQVSFSTPQPVYLAPENKLQQRGAKIYTAGNAQLFADVDLTRRGMYIQNECPTAIWVSLFGDNNTLDSYPNIEVRPGQLYETPPNVAPTQAIYVNSRTAGCGFAGATF